MSATTAVSRVLDVPAAAPQTAAAYFSVKLSVETDPWDVNHDLANGTADGFVLLDARRPESYAEEHVKGAVNLHHGAIDASTVSALPKGKLIVVYCTSPACNAAAKAAVKLAKLGFQVKEMIGGLEYWKKDGYLTEKGH